MKGGADRVGRGSPVNSDEAPIPLYEEEFWADPHRGYGQMRARFGSLVPVELGKGVPATLVIGYNVGKAVLHDSERFPADPRPWQYTVPEECPVLSMMEWKPAARFSTGTAHERYRKVSVDALGGINRYRMYATLETIAEPLITAMTHRAGLDPTAPVDLVGAYAVPLVSEVLNQLIGCPPEPAAQAAAGTAVRFESTDPAQTARGMQLLSAALSEVVTLKAHQPGDDITTRLMGHPEGLTAHEGVAQLMSIHGAGVEATLNLLANTLRLLLCDNTFGSALSGGSLSIRDALDEVLFTDPPMANFSFRYPRRPVFFDDVCLPADQPVIVSLAGCNNDPAITGDLTGNRSHLAWGAGVHECPAQQLAYQIAHDAVELLLDTIPEIRLSTQDLHWRPSPFLRGLATLPVTLEDVALPVYFPK